VNEILTEMHAIRHGLPLVSGSPSLSSRLLAQTIPLRPDTVNESVLNRLKKEQIGTLDVASGRKHILELVNVRVLDGFQSEVDVKLRIIAEEITEAIFARCLVDVVASCSEIVHK
jgi:hypothetical protein